MNRTRTARVLGFIALAAMIALLLSGCDADTPQNTFNPAGEVAKDQRNLFLLAMWPAIAVMILVEGVIVITLLRFRRKQGDEMPNQTHGNTPLELTWTILPALLLAVLGIPMMIMLFDLGREPKADAFHVEVIGQQWAWSFEYPDIKGPDGQPLQGKIGEVHFPVGREISINLRSRDVIHSFAIPRIAGTRDAIPSHDFNDDGLPDHVETYWIRVDEPGTLTGQCREYCGLQHAEMKITAFAQSQADFDAWKTQALAAAYPDSYNAVAAAGDRGN